MKRILCICLSAIMMLSLLPWNSFVVNAADEHPWSAYAATSFSGGCGTEADPYKIATAAELAYLSLVAESNSCRGQYFELVANIDMGEHLWKPISYESDSYAFKGHLRGNGFTISNLNMSTPYQYSASGLFGYLAGSVKDLRLTGISLFTYGSLHHGGAVGFLAETGIIENVHVSGKIINYKSSSQVGGIAGRSYGYIRNCSYSGEVKAECGGPVYVGGIVGMVLSSQKNSWMVENCRFITGLVQGKANSPSQTACVGGIAGYGEFINQCVADGNVRAEGSYTRVGGITGICYDDISQCVSTSWVTAIAEEEGYDFPKAAAGGLVGYWMGGDIEKSYANGCKVSATMTDATEETLAGNVIGYRSSSGYTTKNCYYSNVTIERNMFKDGGDCDADSWPVSTSPHTTHSVAGESSCSYSEDLLWNKLGFVKYTPGVAIENGDSNVWLYNSESPKHYWQNRPSLTVRYLDAAGNVLDVFFAYYDSGASYSVVSPTREEADPDISVVKGTITANKRVDVTYSHVHTPGAEANCQSPQICTECGKVMAEKTDHDYALEQVTPPTCEENGYTTHSCSVCGESYVDTYTAAAGHQLNEQMICTVCSASFEAPLRNYIIYVKGRETGKGITQAQVTFGDSTMLTDADGAVKYQLSDDAVAQLRIIAEGYPVYTVGSYKPSDLPSDTIYLEAGDTGIYAAYCNGKDVIAGQTQINTHAYDLQASFTISARAKANILRYELLQDGSVIATSTSGIFSVPNGKFLREKDVYVRMYTDGTEGYNIYQRKLNIYTIGFNLDLQSDWDKLLPFTAGMTLEFPNGVPVLEGLKFNIPNAFGKGQGFGMELGNEKLIITFSDKAKASDVKKDIDNKTRDQILQDLTKEWLGKKYSDGDRSAGGSLALVIEFDKNGPTKAYGQLQLGFELEYEWSRTFVLWIIPLHANVQANLDGGLVLDEIGYDFENDQILIPNLNFKLNGMVYASLGIGCRVLSAGIYGQLKTELEIELIPDPKIENFLISGELGAYLRVKILFWKAMEYRHTFLRGTYQYPDPNGYSMPNMYSLSGYQDASRDYLEDRGPWMGVQTYGEGSNALQTLQNSSYQGIEPQIVQCGDTTMMLFMDDDGSEGKNYQQLYFSLYDVTSGIWGEPRKVNDDLLAEVEFDVCSDGSDIYLLYTQSGEITEENQENYDAITCAMEVMAAKYDPVAGCFVGHINISQNSNYDSNPRIAVNGGAVHAAWVSNPTGDVFAQNANNIIYTAAFTGGNWTLAEPLSQMGATVTSMDVGMLGQGVYAALVRDLDCDLQTADDRVVDLLSLSGVETRLVTVDYDNGGIGFSLLNGSGVLTWINSGNIYCLTAPDAKPEMLLANGVEGLDSDYRICQVDDNVWAVLYTKTFETTDALGNMLTGSDVYGVFCQNGQWGKPVRVTRTEPDAYVDAFDAVMIGQQMLVPYLSTRTAFTQDSFTATNSFMSTKMKLGYDIVVGEAGASIDRLLEGDTLQINALVTNNSWQAVDSVHVQVGDSLGNIVLSRVVDIHLGTGATEIISVELNKADLTVDGEYMISVMPVGHGDTDSDNNTKQLSLWYTDLKVDAKQDLLPENKLQLSYAITNSGNTSGGGTVQIYKLSGENKIVLHTLPLDALKPNQTILGQVEITDSFFDNGTTGTVYVAVIPEKADLYSFNDSQSLYVGGLQYSTTEEVEQVETFEMPVLDRNYVSYDSAKGGDITVSVDEKGCAFQQVEGLDASAYTYENGILTVSASWLQSQTNMFRYLYLEYTNGDKLVQVLLVVEIQSNTLSNPNLTVNAPQSVKFDGKMLEINQDFRVVTPSQGAIRARFSIDGMLWKDGLPTMIGDYKIHIMQDADPENYYAAGECYFNLSIVKGGRGISVPKVLATDGQQIRFANAVPTAGIGDGTILYGYSTVNDPTTVKNWTTEGILPQTDGLQSYYIFAMITEGENYEEATSLGVLAQAHVHSYQTEMVPPDCVTGGYTLHKCTCGDSYKDTYTEATGHTAVTDPAVRPDCVNTGLSEGSHCQVCGAILVAQQVVPEKGHSYQPLFDDAQHYEQCANCKGVRNAADHIFDNACDADCVCGFTRVIEHDFSDAWSSDGTSHWYSCIVCGAKQDETLHDFENGCDTDCAICGYTRTTEHVIDSDMILWSDTEHYRICKECHANLEIEKHSFDNACDTICNGCDFTRAIEHVYDDTCDSLCNICGYVRAITHTFSTSWSANSKHHWHRCLVCNYPSDVQEHIYDNACDETCNVCGWRRSTEHDYQTVWFSNDIDHWHTCSVCGDVTDLSQHVYDNTCDADCNLCGHTRQTIHMYETQWTTDASDHWHICEVCGDITDRAAHAFDNACDTNCNVCGFVREISHDYGVQWEHDTRYHWHICRVCGDVTDQAEHTFDNACDADCNVCGQTREIVHSFSQNWSTDADSHWYTCLVCGDTTDKKAHVHDNTCDTECNVCGQVREIVHDYNTDWSTDEDMHWHTCRVCGDVADKTGHVYDHACDTRCNLCGYTRNTSHAYDSACDADCNVCGDKRTAPHSFTDAWSADENNHWHQCSGCGIRMDEQAHLWDGYDCSICGHGKALRGDVDGNKTVNDADAVYLLRHTLFAALYPLNQSGDMNGDGEVNDKDVVYLLRHTLFPEVYPLS